MSALVRLVIGVLQWLSIFVVSTAISVWLGAYLLVFAFIPALVLATVSLRNFRAGNDSNVGRQLLVDFGLVGGFAAFIVIVAASPPLGNSGYDIVDPPLQKFIRFLPWVAVWAVGQAIALAGISAGFAVLVRLTNPRVAR